MLSGEVEADDFLVAAHDRDEEARRREGHGHAADARDGRAHLGQARAPLPRGRPGLLGTTRAFLPRAT